MTDSEPTPQPTAVDGEDNAKWLRDYVDSGFDWEVSAAMERLRSIATQMAELQAYEGMKEGASIRIADLEAEVAHANSVIKAYAQQRDEYHQLYAQTSADLTAARAECDRLRKGCNPECASCGLRPNNENSGATLYCDECWCESRAANAKLRERVAYLEQQPGDIGFHIDTEHT